MNIYYCYLIYSQTQNTSYIGITNNLDRRIKQHNNIINGGAKATRKATDWTYIKTVLFP